MPVTVPKPALPAPPPPSTPQDKPITRSDLQAALDARDAVWAAHLESVTKALIAAIPQPQPAPKRKPVNIEFVFDNLKNPIGAKLIPEN